MRDFNLDERRMVTDENVVSVTLEELAKQAFGLCVNQTIGFSIEHDSNYWGITKVSRFNTDILLMAPYGGNGAVLYDLNCGKDLADVTEFIVHSLQDEAGDDVYMEMKKGVRHQRWGVVYDYRWDNEGTWGKRFCKNTFPSQEMAENGKAGAVEEDMICDNEGQAKNIHVALFYEWEGDE